MTTMNNKFKTEMAFLQSQHAANRVILNDLHKDYSYADMPVYIQFYQREIAKYVKLQKYIKSQIKLLGELEHKSFEFWYSRNHLEGITFITEKEINGN